MKRETKRWICFGNRVRYDMATLYADALNRILRSKRLAPYMHILLSEGYADTAEHLRWVLREKVTELEAWAKQIKKDSNA